MKLITKTTRSFLIACLLVAGMGGFFCYFLFRKIFNEEATEQLKAQQTKIINTLKTSAQVPHNWFSLTDSIIIEKAAIPISESLQDTLLINPLENMELLQYRILTFGVAARIGYYKVTILKPLYETEDLNQALLITFGMVLLGLVVALWLVNYFQSNRLWQPFYQALDTLKDFRIQDEKPLQFHQTDISEFKNLQQTLTQLTLQIRQDFKNLKTFTENASHELQTPLAVISSNLDILIQSENLTEGQITQISQLIDTIRRLSRLNQTMLLLVKIENQQYTETKPLVLSSLIEDKLELWEAWIQHKNIGIRRQMDESATLKMNPYLADVLLNNLLGNAIKHNFNNGEIYIELDTQKLQVSNTGDEPKQPTDELWGRFQKGSDLPDSHGLGMSLIRQICDVSGFKANYQYANSWHILTLTF